MDITLSRILSLLPTNDAGKIKHGAKADFAKKLGFDSGDIVSMWIKGTSKSYNNYLYDIATLYNVSLAWLKGDSNAKNPAGPSGELLEKYNALDEHGRRLVDLILNAEWERCTKAAPAAEIVNLGTIRHYLSRPAAGVNGLVEGEDYEDIPRTADMPREADFCLTVSGDSMEPYIHDGEMVFISEAAQLHPMDVGVFSVDGATYVKQYAPSYDGSLLLLSANPERETANIVIGKDSQNTVQYFGKVILDSKLPPPIYK